MDSSKLITTIKQSAYFKSLAKSKDVKFILLGGSYANNSQIEGWSDIDLTVGVRNYQLGTTVFIEKLRKEIEQKTKVPTGISIVDIETLRLAKEDSTYASAILKYLNLLLYKSFKTNYKVLYLNNNLSLGPLRINPKELNILPHIFSIHNVVLKTLVSDSITDKAKLRKVLKNTLFLTQTAILKYHGEYLNEYNQALSKFQGISGIDTTNIIKCFELKNQYKNLSNDISLKYEIKTTWNTYQKIFTYIAALSGK